MRVVSLVFAILAFTAALPAKAADWYLAETQHFTIYSEDSEKATLEFARELERLDEVLRIISGVGPDDGSMPDSAKVVVFRFGEAQNMAGLLGNRSSGVGGFFIPRASGSVAFVPRRKDVSYDRSNAGRIDGLDLEPKAVLFHEYVHYFMYQHRNAPYPGWYREGFAELFSTLRFEDDRFVIGDTPTWRSVSIMAVNIDLKKMLDPPTKNYDERIVHYYGHGWLLASLLNFTPERRPQITEYITQIAKGTDRLEAAKIAFGDLDQLEKELKAYRTSAAKVLKIPYMNKEEPAVEVRKLGEDEVARMDLMIASNVGVDEKRAARQLPEARALVERFPQSKAVLLAATEVEFDNKNYAEAEVLAKKILDADPKSIDAAIYYAQVPLMQSLEDPARMAVARERFIAANKMVNDHPVPLFGYYLTYALSGDEMPDNAKAALESAYEFAPFDAGIRTTLVHMFLLEGDTEIANSLLFPLIQSGEGAKFADRLKAALEKYEAGEKEPLLKLVKPRHPAAEPEDDDDEEDGEGGEGGEGESVRLRIAG